MTLLPILSLLLAQAATAPTPAAPAESWRFYGGDYTTWSALDTLSVRREGDRTHSRQAIWGQRGPLDVDGRDFDYVVVETVHDCAAQTSWSVRAHYHSRDGALLWSTDINSRPRSTASSSPFTHYRDYLCADAVPVADPRGYPSLRAMFERNRSWLVTEAPGQRGPE
ncbi:MAG TPA: hypothetical protein VD887_01095 [Allosphingosinicella sp.]|nr:hypothetical protein [Allosphingosinicella sp.]